MTLFDAMPSVWTALSFVLLCSTVLSGSDLLLLGCGASFAGLSVSLCGSPIRYQSAVFFAYLAAVGAARLIKRRMPEGDELAVALTDIDPSGGTLCLHGAKVDAVTRDGLFVCRRGDVLTVRSLPDGTRVADRV